MGTDDYIGTRIRRTVSGVSLMTMSGEIMDALIGLSC